MTNPLNGIIVNTGIPKTALNEERGDTVVTYPVLAGEIARRGIKKKTIAESIGVCDKSLSNKLAGKVPFTWPEVSVIKERFFPDMTPEELFQKSNDGAQDGA